MLDYKSLRKYREFILISIDVIFVVLSYLLAYYVRVDFGNQFSEETFFSVIELLPFTVLIHIVFSIIFKINRTLWTYISIDEVIRVTVSIFLTNIVWFICIICFNVVGYPRTVPVIASLFSIVTMLGIRITYRFYRRSVLQQNRKHRALIIGAGQAGAIALRDLTVTDRYDCKVVGFVDDNIYKKGKIISGVEILGTTKDLEKIVEKTKADIAYIAIKNLSVEARKNIIDQCKKISLNVKIITFETVDGDKLATRMRDVSIDDLLGRGEIKLDNTEISTMIHQKTVMVTGGGGSIGSEICRQIVKYQPKQLLIVDIYENNMYDLQQEIKMKQLHGEIDKEIELICLIASVREKKRIDTIMNQYHPDVVFHAAAHKHVPLVEDSPAEAIKNNVFGTYNVVKSAIEHKVDTFVLISTDKAVNPTNVMGATKRMCELVIQGLRDNPNTKLCAVRFGNVLGSNGSVIPLFKRQIESGGPVTVTDPNIIRYFMTIPEAASLVIQAGVYAKSGEIFVLDMGEPVKILDLAKNLIQLSGFVPDEDIKITFTGLRPGEKMYEELILDKEKHTKTRNDLIYTSQPIEFTEKDLENKLSKLKKVLDLDNNTIRNTILELIK